MKDRDNIQRQATDEWLKVGRGTILLPTGVGKTRVGRMCHDEIKSESTIVVTSRIPIVDGWKKEFGDRKAKFMVINSASKYQGECDLLIVDEVHSALSDARYNVFSNIKYKYLLCLTATLPKKKPEYMQRLLSLSPVIYERSMKEMLELSQVVAEFQVYNIPVTMDNATKFKYAKWNGAFREASIELSRLKRLYQLDEYKSLFDVARAFNGGDINGPNGEVVKAAKAFWWAMSMRKRSLYDNESKLHAIRTLISKYPGKRWIIFSKSTRFADMVAKMFNLEAYHSKNKNRAKVLEDFASGKTNVLSTVDAVNEGVDLPEVDAAIATSSVSSGLIGQQQLGRIVRFKLGKKAPFFNLYVPGTPEERWVTEKTEELGAINITMDELKA